LNSYRSSTFSPVETKPQIAHGIALHQIRHQSAIDLAPSEHRASPKPDVLVKLPVLQIGAIKFYMQEKISPKREANTPDSGFQKPPRIRRVLAHFPSIITFTHYVFFSRSSSLRRQLHNL
jgi:hypothetical protein